MRMKRKQSFKALLFVFFGTVLLFNARSHSAPGLPMNLGGKEQFYRFVNKNSEGKKVVLIFMYNNSSLKSQMVVGKRIEEAYKNSPLKSDVKCLNLYAGRDFDDSAIQTLRIFVSRQFDFPATLVFVRKKTHTGIEYEGREIKFGYPYIINDDPDSVQIKDVSLYNNVRAKVNSITIKEQAAATGKYTEYKGSFYQMENKSAIPNGYGSRMIYEALYAKQYIIESTGTWVNGIKNGEFKEYDTRGNLVFNGNYIDGLREGTGRVFHYNDPAKIEFEAVFSGGHAKSGARFSKTGEVVYRGELASGKNQNKLNCSGQGEEYYPDKNMKARGTFINDKITTGELFDASGNLVYKGEFVDGRQKYLSTAETRNSIKGFWIVECGVTVGEKVIFIVMEVHENLEFSVYEAFPDGSFGGDAFEKGARFGGIHRTNLKGYISLHEHGKLSLQVTQRYNYEQNHLQGANESYPASVLSGESYPSIIIRNIPVTRNDKLKERVFRKACKSSIDRLIEEALSEFEEEGGMWWSN